MVHVAIGENEHMGWGELLHKPRVVAHENHGAWPVAENMRNRFTR